MRKITEKATRAFENGKNFNLNNTKVVVDEEGKYLYLHGNKIARQMYENNFLEVCLQGYNTPTTRERLNGLSGVNIKSKNFTPYLNGVEINSYEWVKVGV